ncbi:MAG: HNH endonuclease signature motif containing protein [Bacteroidota bacterium]
MSMRKQQIEERANGCCEYYLCPADFCPDPFSIEHIQPLVKEGSENLDNLAFSCQGCNNRKYVFTEAIDPVSGKIVPLYHPRKDDW